MTALSNEVLPEPTSPITQTNSPFLIEMSTDFSVTKSLRGFATSSSGAVVEEVDVVD
jgi:hypothetical protein